MVTKEQVRLSVKQRIAKLINYFLKGLLIVLPIAVTYTIIKAVIFKIDEYFDVGIPAVGFVIAVASLTLLGYIGSRIFTAPLLALIDDFLSHIPFVKVIYTSVKDLIEAFVGDKKKFTQGVLVEWTPGMYKPGFITQEDLAALNLPGLTAVYFPLSYAFSGNLFLVEKRLIKPFDGNPTDVMKFIVSGGVISMDHDGKHPKTNPQNQ